MKQERNSGSKKAHEAHDSRRGEERDETASRVAAQLAAAASHRPRAPQYQFPSGRPPPLPQPQAHRLGRDNTPAASHLSPYLLHFVAQVQPDTVWIDTISWNNLIPQDATYKGGAAGGPSVYVQPHGPMLLNYRIHKGILPFTQALLVAHVGDGLIAPAHVSLTLPAALTEISGTFSLDGWPSPFPANLYGYHQVSLELWAVDPNGTALPAASQTNPPDTRTFRLEHMDWAWLWVFPGCRSTGGLLWTTLDKFSIAPNQVTLDASGTHIAAGQKVTVNWQCSDVGLPATAYGFKGSFPGVRFYLPDGSAVDSPLLNGPLVIDLSGKAFVYSGITILWNGTTGCGFEQRTIGLQGVVPNIPPPPPTPCNLIVSAGLIEPKEDPDPYTAFTVYFVVANNGGTKSGPFNVHLEADNAAYVGDVGVGNLDPGCQTTIDWPFKGQPPGDHFAYCYVDLEGKVVESTKADNSAYNGWKIW